MVHALELGSKTSMPANVTIPVALPADALGLCSDPDQVGHEMAELWLLDHVRLGHLSAGRAAELLQISVTTLISRMADHGIPYPNYSVDDLRREVGLPG